MIRISLSKSDNPVALFDLDKLILIMMYSDDFTNGMSANDAITQAGKYLDRMVFDA